jgi:hypothetical protein
MKQLLIAMLSFSTLACVTGYNPRFDFNEIQVVNLSTATIRDVRVVFVGSPKTLGCDEVAKHAMCADRFGRRFYPQQGIELSWTHTDGSRKSEIFSPQIPVTYFTAFPLRIVMEVNANGSVKAFYEQDEPGRDGDSLFTVS